MRALFLDRLFTPFHRSHLPHGCPSDVLWQVLSVNQSQGILRRLHRAVVGHLRRNLAAFTHRRPYFIKTAHLPILTAFSAIRHGHFAHPPTRYALQTVGLCPR